MGSTVTNQCQLGLRLPPVFFRILLDPAWRPTVGDMAALDPSFRDTVRRVEDLDAAGFAAILEVEGGSFGGGGVAALQEAKERYLMDHVSDFFTFSTGDSWQFRDVRAGLQATIPLSVLAALRASPEDLSDIVCGAPDSSEANFDFREVFQVVMDPELQTCTELQNAFWETVDGLEPAEKRLLLLFITGVAR